MRYNSSCNEKEYEKAKPFYETALNESEPKTTTTCTKTTKTMHAVLHNLIRLKAKLSDAATRGVL